MMLTGLARLGRDAELRTTQSGDKVATLSLAFNYGRKGDDGKRPTQWVEAALWGKLAEALIDYLVKGQQVCVAVDEPHIETFETRDGRPGTKLVGRITSIELAGGRDAASAPAPRPAAPAAAPRPAPAPRAPIEDDDIPFN